MARPDEAFADASAAPTVPTGPGTAGHPGHFPGQAIVDDVAQAGERLVAVGYVGVRGSWTAVSWTSDDGDRWSLGTIDDAPGSLAVSLAVPAGAGSHIVAAGRSGREPAAWVSADGRVWTRRAVPTLSGGSTWERIVTVLATDEGLVAGGSAGPELGERHARFWRSADGTTWVPVPDDLDFARLASRPLSRARCCRSRSAGPGSSLPAASERPTTTSPRSGAARFRTAGDSLGHASPHR